MGKKQWKLTVMSAEPKLSVSSASSCVFQADIGTDSPYHLSPKDPGFRGCTTRKSKVFDVDCFVNHAVCVSRSKKCQWKGKFRKKQRGK